MASVALEQDNCPLPERLTAGDRPARALALDGAVTIELPDQTSMIFTADAALETAHRLMDAGLKAKRQSTRRS